MERVMESNPRNWPEGQRSTMSYTAKAGRGTGLNLRPGANQVRYQTAHTPTLQDQYTD